MNTQTDVAPAPVYYLRGDHLPSMLTCIYDAAGRLAACASESMRYHPEGPLSGWIFAGGVSVSPDRRRKALGGPDFSTRRRGQKREYTHTYRANVRDRHPRGDQQHILNFTICHATCLAAILVRP